MNTNYYAKTKRQYKYLIKRLNRLLLNGEWEKLSETKQNRFKKKLKILFQKLEGSFSSPSLIKAMGAAALVLGLSLNSMGQSFKAPVTNPFSLVNKGGPGIPSMVDIDGDGDLDLFDIQLDAYSYSINVEYRENTGTKIAPVFGSGQINPFGITVDSLSYKSIFADLDNDGDYDMLRTSYYGNHLYYENTGSKTAATFAAPTINPYGLTGVGDLGLSIFVDLDADGDMDLFTGEYYGDFHYYENTGTKSAPQFASAAVNPFGLTNSGGYVSVPEFADVDGDGDMDLMFVEYYGDFHYYKNTGTKNAAQFTAVTTNPFNLANTGSYPSFMTFADLDGDSDEDLFVIEYYGDFMYYENASGIGIEESQLSSQLNVFPNPTSGFVNISLDDELGSAHIELTSTSGQIVLSQEIESTSQVTLDVSHLNSGVYIVKLNADNRVGIKKLIIE